MRTTVNQKLIKLVTQMGILATLSRYGINYLVRPFIHINFLQSMDYNEHPMTIGQPHIYIQSLPPKMEEVN